MGSGTGATAEPPHAGETGDGGDPDGADMLVVTAGGTRHRLVGRDEWVLGRAGDADVRLRGQLVGRRHAALRRGPHGWTLHDLDSRNGTWQGDERISAVDVPAAGITLHLGAPVGVRVTLLSDDADDADVDAAVAAGSAGPTAPPPAPQPPTSAVPLPDAATRPAPGAAGRSVAPAVHVLPRGASARLGRDPAGEVALDDPAVSRNHAVLDPPVYGRPAVLTDVGSSNGTYVNGVRTVVTLLRPGDVIGLGSLVLRYDGVALVEERPVPPTGPVPFPGPGQGPGPGSVPGSVPVPPPVPTPGGHLGPAAGLSPAATLLAAMVAGLAGAVLGSVLTWLALFSG